MTGRLRFVDRPLDVRPDGLAVCVPRYTSSNVARDVFQSHVGSKGEDPPHARGHSVMRSER